MRQALLAAALSLDAPVAHADDLSAPRETGCAFGAFVTETDPAGLNVRQGPGTAEKVLGRLPPVFASEELSGYKVKVEVEVAGSRDGWFRITRARGNTALTGKPARILYKGTCWVNGRKLTLKSQAGRGHERPDVGSPVVLRMADGHTLDGDDFVAAGQLVACSGRWALVEFTRDRQPAETASRMQVEPAARRDLPAGRVRSLVNQICGIQEILAAG